MADNLRLGFGIGPVREFGQRVAPGKVYRRRRPKGNPRGCDRIEATDATRHSFLPAAKSILDTVRGGRHSIRE